MTEETFTRTRARTRRVTTGTTEPQRQQSLEQMLESAWAAKVAADDAKNLYDKARAALQDRMTKEGRKEVELVASGNRPAISGKIAKKTTNTIDPEKYAKLVTREQFAKSVTVTAAEAKKFVAEDPLKKITTSKEGYPYVDIRAKGRSSDNRSER